MPTVKMINFNGEEVGEFSLTDAVFGAPIHVPAMHQVVLAQLANRRLGTQAAKGKGEVSGGGKKPWRQKHTGRARHGSTRSPLWIHGGVSHPPKPRDFRQKVNKKVRALAIRSALSLKVRDDLFTIINEFPLEKPSTKSMTAFLKSIDAKKPLVLVGSPNMAVAKSARNIQGAKVLNVGNINVYDLMNAKELIVTPEAVACLEEVYSR